jgi:hypothetical protein
MTLKLSTKNENIMLWQMPFQGKKKKQKVHYVLFLFYNLVGWKNKGYNGSKIKRYARSFNNYMRTPIH